MAKKATPDNFMVLDMESGNAVAFYDSQAEAERCFRDAVAQHPQDAAELMLVAYDKHGRALSRTTGFSLLSS
ncbi:MAG: hypothetical protein WEE66_13525 [Actinomycetota bacterium]